jgi:hypothetical protein
VRTTAVDPSETNYLLQLKGLKDELAALRAARGCQKSPGEIAATLLARLQELETEREAFEQLPTAEQIAFKQKQLAELPADIPLADLERREIELDIIELQGGSSGLLTVARDRANEDARFRRPMRAIPSEREVAAFLEAERARVERITPAPRQQQADVIQLDDYRPRDVLADYRGRPQVRLEPDHV